MKKRPIKLTEAETLEIVRVWGLTLPNVEAATKYDGSPVLKVGGRFMAGLATHPSAEPDTLVVRHGLEEREWLLEEAPETYYTFAGAKTRRRLNDKGRKRFYILLLLRGLHSCLNVAIGSTRVARCAGIK